MSAGVLSGLQNQYEGLGASWVGSIPTHSRHYYLSGMKGEKGAGSKKIYSHQENV